MHVATRAVTDFLSAVPVPKQVVIKNARLGALLNILKVVAVLFVILLTLSSKSYYRDVPVSGHPTIWTDSTDSEYAAAVAVDAEKPVCTQPSKFEYHYDANWHYDKISCVEQFSEERKAYKVGLDSIFIPTFFVETRTQRVRAPSVDANGAPNCTGLAMPCGHGWRGMRAHSGPLCECKGYHSHFVIGIESVRVGLEHHFVFNDKSASFLSSSDTATQANFAKCDGKDSHMWECYKKGQELLTLIVLADTDKVIDSSVSPDPLSLKIGDLLKAADISLDETFDETVDNLKKCGVSGSDPATCSSDVPIRPVLRMVGLDVSLKLEYTNKGHFPSGFKETKGHDGPLCLIKVTISKKWTAAPKTDCKSPRDSATSESDCVQDYWHGIRISIEATGHFGVLDPQNLLVTIGAGLVYLGIPFQIVALIAVTCLGPSSKVYARGASKEVRIEDEFSELVAKSVTSAHTVRSITDGKPITKDHLEQHIRSVFKSDDIDDHEMKILVDAAFRRLIGYHNGDADAEDAAIQVHDMVEALQGDMRLCEARQLFDADRQKSLMERIFRPSIYHTAAPESQDWQVKVAPAPDVT